MNEINNMGGILFADILSKNEIALFTVNQGAACIRIAEGHKWMHLPTIGIIEAPTINPEVTNASTIYKYSATIRFPRHIFSTGEENYLRNKIVEGCILRCQDTSGHKYIYGTQEHPLFGTLNIVIGKKTTDLSGYELQLSGTTLHPILSYMEI